MPYSRLSELAGLVLLAAIATQVRAEAQGTQSSRDTVPARDLMDVIASILNRPPRLADTVQVENKLTLSLLPSISVNPATGVALGVSGNGAVRFGRPRIGRPEQTTLSAFSLSANYTTKGQLNLLLRSSAYGVGNRWKLEGDWRYLDTNQPTYGLGPAQPSARESPMDFRLVRFYSTGYLEAVPSVLLGVGYHMDVHFDIVDRNAASGVVTPFLEYNAGQTITHSVSSGLSLNALTDTRDNPINPRRGVYAWGSLRLFPTWLGSDATWQSLQGEFRVYPWVDTQPRQILAIWTSVWLTFGQTPYLDLPAIGWDYSNRTGRGYAQGRIRARDLLYGEIEYRRGLTTNGLVGATAFVNFTTTSDPATGELNAPNVGFGVGIRLKLNKRSDTNITLDYAFGAQGSRGFFLGSGEAF